MKIYSIKEIFRSLQGEGLHSGRPMVMARFSGCNLWTGVESDRSTAVCKFCDTKFVGVDGVNGGKYSAVGLAQKIAEVWSSMHRPRFVVLTGGEPMLQVDDHLIDVLHRWECEVAIETNGTKVVPPAIDWITVSPKAGAGLVQSRGDEVKVIFPQDGIDPASFSGMGFRHRYLQPMDNDEREANTRAAVEYCLKNPGWKLSLQTHKVLGLK